MLRNNFKNKNFWFFSRKRLFIPVFIDALIYYLSLFILNLSFTSISIDKLNYFLVLNLWIFLSYIVGKYNVKHKTSISITRIILFKSLLVNIIVLMAINIIFLGEYNFSNNYFRYFINLLALFSLLSTLFQSILSFNFNKLYNKRSVYLFIGNVEKYKIIKKEIKISDFNFDLLFSEPKINMIQQKKSLYDGIIFENLNLFSEDIIDLLLKYKAKGLSIFSLFSWCNRFLQRLPPELVYKSDLINQDILLNNKTLHFRMKRAADVIFSSILLIIFIPIFLVVAFTIYLQDGGNVFYSQERTGYKGKPFKILKFRTMKIDAESKGAQWASKNDKRITKFGNYLRMFRIDELPQLIYVIQGSMTLIGPRPERPEFDKNLIEKVPHYSLRYTVKPGLSGWAQVNYPYGSSIEDSINKLSFDLYYLKNFSFQLDCLIFFKTIRLVFNKMLSEPNN